MRSKDYGPDVLAESRRRPAPPRVVSAEIDLVVECSDTGYCGAVVGVEKDAVTLEDRFGKRRAFALSQEMTSRWQQMESSELHHCLAGALRTLDASPNLRPRQRD